MLHAAVLALVLGRYEPIPFPGRPCPQSNYFDVSALACLPCPSLQEPDATGTSCICIVGHVLSGTSCVQCNATVSSSFLTAPTRDRTACLPCAENGTDATLGLLGSECACPTGAVLVERDGHGGLLDAKRCLACPVGSYAASATECRVCPRPNMVAGTSAGGCVCAADHRQFVHPNGWWGNELTCVDSTAYAQLENFYSATALQMRYVDLPTSQGGTFQVDESKIMQQLLLPSAAACLLAVQASSLAPRAQPLLEGNQACQAVGNLCVLKDYDTSTTACTLYRELQSRSGTTGLTSNQQWRARMPGLYYAERGIAPITASATDIDSTMALPPNPGSRLRFVLAPYSLNGTFLGLVELTTQLQLCTGGASSPQAFLNFATSMRITCDVPPTELLATQEPVFYDLYFYYESGVTTSAARLADLDTGSLYPVPLRVLNYRVGGLRINDNRDSQGRLVSFDDQLTRRFFTVDGASGVESSGQMPRVLRYLRSATLTTTMRTTDSSGSGFLAPNRILPPLLEVEYAEVLIPLAASSPIAAETQLAASEIALTSTFAATYTMEMETSNATINFLFVIALVVWLLVTLLKTVMFFRRNQSSAVDGDAMIRLFAVVAEVFALTFFSLIFGVTIWWFITFKNGNELFLLMPAELPPSIFLGIMPFQIFISCMFGAKLVHVLDIVRVQTQHDLFFLDWEQPRAQKSEGGDDDEPTTSSSRAKGGDDRKGMIPVSAWRRIFVANEWVKLQDVRAISMEVNLICLLFLLRGLGMEEYARLVPEGRGEPGVPYHTLLRFALSSALLLALSLVQYLFRWALWERFVKDRIWQFVDLLAVTNISALLLEERYFGFYLHGRSVHDHADTDMSQLNANLKREEEGLEMLRGFRQDSRVQTFEIYLSPKVRQRYDAAFVGGLDGPARVGKKSGAANANPRRRGFRAAPEDGLRRHRELSRFLMSYLGTPTGNNDAGSAEGRPEVRAKMDWERRIGMPPAPEYGRGERSIFLEDASGRFKRLLLAGREGDMVLLAVLTYALLDMATANTFVAVFATYAMDVGIRTIRTEYAIRNIAAKTLVDDRFLL